MHALAWYTLAALIVWIPTAVAIRPSHSRVEQLFGALFVALAWPITLPVLLLGVMTRTDRVIASR